MGWILLATCADAPGISAAVTGFLADSGTFILESQQHGDPDTGLFFLRIAFRPDGEGGLRTEDLRATFAATAGRFGMRWSITEAADRPRTILAVSRFGHCLNALLHQWRAGTLPIDVVGIVSNHDDMRDLADWHGVPYHHLPVRAETRQAQEAAMLRIIEETGTDLVVLARYMQILSDGFSEVLSGKCINIHHSFLPSFKGAKPYHQAHARGVKIIGATAHYVTSDLDEGPIIEQDVERISHARTAEQLVKIGEDIEARVLSRAVRWHAERRVLLNGAKTIIFH